MERYKEIFMSVLELTEEELKKNLKREEVGKWDSLAHVTLISEIEDAYEIMFDPEDILVFDSYEVGKELLNKYL